MLWILGVSLIMVASVINIAFTKKPRTAANIVEIVLLWTLFFQVGVVCLLAYYGHVFNGPEIAAQIGWPAGSGFQYEVGMMNLGLGILGILCFWFRKDFWLATAIIASVVMVGCGVGHIREIVLHNNLNPYNAGLGIWLETTLMPAILLTLAYFYRKLNTKCC
jgi:hypothetical protein